MLSNPVFWICVYLVGYITVVVVLSLKPMLTEVETKVPKPIVRIFILFTFLAPPIALPFTEGPKIGIPRPVALILGIVILVVNFVIKILGQKEIGKIPALKSKGKLVTQGIYGTVRHPLYMSNGLLAMGMAILFQSVYAFLFSIAYSLSYLLIIYFEEKDLLEKYGEEYLEYKRKVAWRMVPKLF